MSRVQSLLMSMARQGAKNVAADPDARAYINAVRNADGGRYMEPGVQRAINDFVIGCKADGIWSSIKACCILAGARTLAGALTPLVGTAPTNFNFVSGDYSRNTGLKGNGTNKRIDTGRAGNADGQDDMHAAVYVSTVQSGALQRSYISDGGFSGQSGQTHLIPAGTSLVTRSRSSTAQVTSARNAAGFIGLSRSQSGEYVIRGNGQNSTLSQQSAAPQLNTFSVFSVAAVTYSDAEIAFYSVGSSLTLSTLGSRVQTLVTAIGAAIP